MKNRLQQIKAIENVQEMAGQLHDFVICSNCDAIEEMFDDAIVRKSTVLNDIHNSVENGNLKSIKSMIKYVTEYSAEYFTVDALGNYHNLTRLTILNLIEEMEYEIE